MQRVSRARVSGESLGLLKALLDASTQGLPGAASLDLRSNELIRTRRSPMVSDKPVSNSALTMAIQPTLSELIPTLQQFEPVN